MAENNPFQQFGVLNENDQRAQIYNMRIMHMAEQAGAVPRTHFAGGRGGLGQNPMLSQVLGQQANEPDYSQFTYDPQAHAAAQKYLGQFGLSPVSPQQVNPNAFLPNSGFFGRHPGVSRMLEGGVFGAAATKGSDTIGEGISNAAGGLLEGQLARKGMINRQFARPFEAASMLEGMQDRTQKRELQEAEIQHLRAENQKLGRPDHDFRAFGVGRDTPTIATVDSTTGEVKTVANPDYDPKEAARTRAGGSEWGAYLQDMQERHPSMTVQEISKQYAKDHQAPERPPHALVGTTDPKTGVTTYEEVRPGSQTQPGSPIPQTTSQLGAAPAKEQARADKKTKARNDYIKSQSKDNEFLMRNFGKTVLDKGIEKQVGDYWDQYIGPSWNTEQ
jgi:hypothetical protein